MNAVADKLRNFRASQTPPLKPGKVAADIGVSRSTYFRWEDGTRQIGKRHLPKVAEVTGIPAKELRPDLAEALEVAE